MSTRDSIFGRRDFVRIGGAASLGLGLNLQRCLAEALGPGSADAGAKAAMSPNDDLLVGLDIGTSKVRVLVGERQPDDTIKILGVGQAAALGILSGEVVDSEAAVKCVREALVDAEVKTDVMIGRTHLAVFGGPDIHGVGGRVKHCVRCVNDVGVEVDDIALRPLASARAVLDLEQEMRGALVIDVGAGTTSYIVLAGGQIKSWGVRDVGGDHITGELSLGLRIPMAGAERRKMEQGSVDLGHAIEGERIVFEGETSTVSEEVESNMLNTIIRRRMLDIFRRTKVHLEGKGVQLGALVEGVHLTGGGSKLPGIDELAREVFGIPARLASAKGIVWAANALESPEYSCAIGLLKLGAIRTESPGDAGEARRRYFYVLPERAA
jgi:cell division ATPase FtsA